MTTGTYRPTVSHLPHVERGLKAREAEALRLYGENLENGSLRVAGFWAGEAERYARLLLGR